MENHCPLLMDFEIGQSSAPADSEVVGATAILVVQEHTVSGGGGAPAHTLCCHKASGNLCSRLRVFGASGRRDLILRSHRDGYAAFAEKLCNIYAYRPGRVGFCARVVETHPCDKPGVVRAKLALTGFASVDALLFEPL